MATNSFEDAWTDPDVLFVGGGAKPTLDLLGDSAAIAFWLIADHAPAGCGVSHRFPVWGPPDCSEATALQCIGRRSGCAEPIWRRAQRRTRLHRPQSAHRW